jgi:hypothetical protein
MVNGMLDLICLTPNPGNSFSLRQEGERLQVQQEQAKMERNEPNPLTAWMMR